MVLGTRPEINPKGTETTPAGIRCAVVGASGYSGRELARLLLSHPVARLCACFSTSGQVLGSLLPEKAVNSVPDYHLDELLPRLKSGAFHVVFLATPVPVSLELAGKILEFGVHVIDLSGAFRLSAGSPEDILANYKSWYSCEHPSTALVKRAEYGLVPWVSDSSPPPSGARLIANPGCYATAILMGLLPLLKNNLIEVKSLVIDAKSGTTGAGRKAEERLLHSEVDGNCTPYRIGRHQHQPEIEQFAKALTGIEIDPHFTPHLINVRRGIIAGLYARLQLNTTAKQIEAAYCEAYGENPLIDFGSVASHEHLLSLRRVVGSSRTQIAYFTDKDKLYVFSLIDNLLKGAASQAVENLNRLLSLASSVGLTDREGVL